MKDEWPAAMLEAKDASNAELADEDEQAASHDVDVGLGPDVAVCEGLGVEVEADVELRVGLGVTVVDDELIDALELSVEGFGPVLVEFAVKVAGRVNGN